MLSACDLPDTVPVFPLPQALMLPRAHLPLHIFEPRYLAMLDDTLKSAHRLITMVQPREVPGGGERKLHAIGCAGRLTQFSETEDGRYMITLTGVSRCRVQRDVSATTPYLRAAIDWAGFERDLGRPETDPGFEREAFLNLLARYFAATGLSTDWENLKEADSELLVNSLSMLCPFCAEDKQALLEAPTLATRRETLATLMQFALSGGSSDEEAVQ